MIRIQLPVRELILADLLQSPFVVDNFSFISNIHIVYEKIVMAKIILTIIDVRQLYQRVIITAVCSTDNWRVQTSHVHFDTEVIRVAGGQNLRLAAITSIS